MAAMAFWSMACQRPSQPIGTSASASAPASAAVLSDAQLAVDLCAGRAGCRVRRRRAVPGADGVAVVDVALDRGPASPECSGAEYWLVRPGSKLGARLIARDCDEQTEADGVAHADTRIEGGDLVVAYEERRGGDRCEGVDARVTLVPLRVVSETRWDGASHKNRCSRENEIATDWDKSAHLARFTQAACQTLPGPSSAAASGAAVPKVSLDGSGEPNQVGSCGVLVDRSRAAQWMDKGAAIADVRLRAVSIDDKLLVDVDGATSGTLKIIVASASETDGDHGGVGCAPETERHVSTTSIHLEDGRMESKGTQAPFVRIASRDATGVHLATESVASVGRVALSYESPTHARLESAALPAIPAARNLPPLHAPPGARCRVEAGRLELRRDDTTSNPVLRLH
jgi:hypothetical protein